jgi:hypothetical protein
MRIAAGVLIIVVAITNFMAGCGYAFVGGLESGLGEIGGEMMDGVEGGEAAAGEADKMVDSGQGKVAYGFFMLALGGLEIAAGVVLFMGTAAMLIKVTAGLEIASVVIAAAVYSSMGIFSALGIVAAILAFLGAQQISAALAGGGGGGEEAPPPPPPVEEPPAPAAEG